MPNNALRYPSFQFFTPYNLWIRCYYHKFLHQNPPVQLLCVNKHAFYRKNARFHCFLIKITPYVPRRYEHKPPSFLSISPLSFLSVAKNPRDAARLFIRISPNFTHFCSKIHRFTPLYPTFFRHCERQRDNFYCFLLFFAIIYRSEVVIFVVVSTCVAILTEFTRLYS